VSETRESRFWSKVRKGDGCWEWADSIDTSGYGRIKVGSKYIAAHRFAWEVTHGPIYSWDLVLHSCDRRNCVRPDHLRLGSQAQNMADMRARDRANGPLTPEQECDLIAAYTSGATTMRGLAATYGVGLREVSGILCTHGVKTKGDWKRTTVPIPDAVVAEASRLYMQGVTLTDLAKRLRVGRYRLSSAMRKAGVVFAVGRPRGTLSSANHPNL